VTGRAHRLRIPAGARYAAPMTRIAALALAALALAASLLAACNKQERAPAPDDKAAPAPAPGDKTAPAAEIPASEALRRITELADKICACPDRACAEAARVALEQENRKQAERPREKPTPAEADAMRGQAKRISDCVTGLP